MKTIRYLVGLGRVHARYARLMWRAARVWGIIEADFATFCMRVRTTPLKLELEQIETDCERLDAIWEGKR